MSEFIYQGFKKGELELINQCHLYLQVITLADIATADGTAIDETYLGPAKHGDRVSLLQWPTQHCPSPRAWSQWRKALQYLQYKGKIVTPLGQWTSRPHQRWAWVFRSSDNVLYHQLRNGWEKFQPVAGGRGTLRTRSNAKLWYFKDTATATDPPDGELAAATLVYDNMDGDLFTILVSGAFPKQQSRSEEMTKQPVEEDENSQLLELGDIRFQQLVPGFLSMINASKYFRRLVGPMYSTTEPDLLEVINSITSGTLLVCRDGSFSQHSGTGSHAWVFATATGQILLQGAGPIDCHPKQLSSYRPELGGITSLLFLL